MGNKNIFELYQEAETLEHTLLKLFFDTEMSVLPTKYNSFQVARACQNASFRKERRQKNIIYYLQEKKRRSEGENE